MKKQLLFAAALLASVASNVCAQTDGDYYLYDAANKVFLSRGGSWGTEATADKYGVPFTWTSATGIINFKDWANAGLHIESNGTSVYTDNGSPTAFAFVETTGGYYLQNSDKSSYARHSSGDYGEYVNMTTDATTATVWKLLSKAERDAIVNAYPTENISNIITTAGLTNVTADKFESNLATNYAASTVQTIDPNKYTWKQYSRSNANSSTPREVYQGTGIFTDTIKGLTKGIYKVTTYAFDRNAGNADCVTLNAAGYNIATAFIAANKEQVRVKGWAEDRASDSNPNSVADANTLFNTGKYANSVYTYVGDDGIMYLSVKVPSFHGSHWFIFGNTVLTYYNDAMSEADATAAITKAEALQGQAMETSASTTLTNALTAFKADKTIANYNVLSAAMTAAQTSANAYVGAKAALAAMKAVMDGTNVYTTDAYNTYNTLYTDNLTKYTNGTLTTAEATAIENPSKETGWRASNNVQGFLMSAWGTNDWDALHINTWSNEGDSDGSNFIVPFYEYWTSGTSLGAKTISATMTGIAAGTYKVSALVRVQKNADPATGITLKVNDGQTTDVTTATQIGTSKLYMDTFSATGTVGTDGNLTITFDVADNSNISWLAFKNVKFEKVTATSINSVSTAANDNNIVRYNLNGQRIYGAVKGLYIENGKKVIK